VARINEIGTFMVDTISIIIHFNQDYKWGGVLMKKFFLVLTAIYLLFLALLGSILCIVGFIGLNAGIESIPADFNPLFIFATYIPFIGWLLATGIGLLLKRHWARYSIMVMSGLAIFMGIIFCLIFSLVPLPENATENLIFKTIFLGSTSIFLIILPVVYLFFFTRQSVKELFGTTKSASRNSTRPRGISVLAIFYLISGMTSLMTTLFPMYQSLPLCGGIILSGIYLRLYMFIVSLITLYLAYGFWKLQKAAWITYIIFNGFGLIIGLINIFTFDQKVLSEMMPANYPESFSLNSAFYKTIATLGLIVSVALMAYVYSKKESFLKKNSISETQLPIEE
jgi:hypothetical protein